MKLKWGKLLIQITNNYIIFFPLIVPNDFHFSFVVFWPFFDTLTWSSRHDNIVINDLNLCNRVCHYLNDANDNVRAQENNEILLQHDWTEMSKQTKNRKVQKVQKHYYKCALLLNIPAHTSSPKGYRQKSFHSFSNTWN